MQTLDIYHGELVGAEVWSEAVCPQQQLLPHQLGVDVLGGLDHALQYSTVQGSTVQYSSSSLWFTFGSLSMHKAPGSSFYGELYDD